MPPEMRTALLGLVLLGSGLSAAPSAGVARAEPLAAADSASLQNAAERFGQVVQADFETPSQVPLTPPGRNPPVKLTQPGQTAAAGSRRPVGGAGALVTIGSSLAIVIGLFLLFAYMVRRTAPGQAAVLPGEVVEVLGRTLLDNRQQVQLLRLGRRLILVSVTPAGVETLAEVADPDEVTRLVGLCQQSRAGSTTAVFRQVFEQLAGEHGRED